MGRLAASSMSADGREYVESTPEGAARRVSRGLLRALERNQLAPGQRLVESDLAAQFGVGRNAVREAIQWLAAHGVIDVTRFRSAAIRQLDIAETLDALEVAEAMIGLVARGAALRYRQDEDDGALAAALQELEQSDESDIISGFARGRRHFYQAMIQLSGNREWRRLFPSLGIHIVHAQYRSPGVQRRRLDDFRALAAAITSRNAYRAEAIGHEHIQHVRAAILAQCADEGATREITG